MKIIHKYVLREHVGPLVFALSALTSLMLLNYVAKQLGNLVGKGLPWTVIGEFFLLSLPFTVAMTLPMAVLVSVLYAFSRLAAENEITALKANGVSLVRLLVPVLIGGAMLTLLMVLFNDQILPRSNHRLRALQGDIARKKPSFALKEQIINEVAPQRFFLRTNHLNRETNLLREVTIYDLSDPLRRRTIYADSGSMAFVDNGADLQLTLYDGFMQEVPKETPTQLQRLYFEIDRIRVPGVANAFERDSSDTFKSDREMSVCELQNEVARYERDYFRAYEEGKRASAAVEEDPNANIAASLVGNQPLLPGTRAPRSATRSLGRVYCDVLVWMEMRGWGNLTMLSLQGALDVARPRAAYAAVPGAAGAPGQGVQFSAAPFMEQDTLRLDSLRRDSLRRDSLRRDSLRRDSLRRDSARVDAARRDSMGQDSARRAARQDSLRQDPAAVARARLDSLRLDSMRQQADSAVRADALARAAVPAIAADSAVFPAAVAQGPDSAQVVMPSPAADSLNAIPTPYTGLAPSAGYAQTISAAVALESARSQMVQTRAQMNQFEVEIHKKFAISVACTVFVLLGAPLALRFPRGGVGLVIGVSLVVFALYYVGLIAGEALADRAILTPFWAMWAANILFTFVGVLLLARMGRESASSRGGDFSELLDLLKGLGRRRQGTSHARTEATT